MPLTSNFPSRLLVLDTATPMLSVALFDGPHLLAADHRLVGRGHAEHLLPAIAALPDGGRCDSIWVGCGPGSFTGIRIAIAAARALAFAWNASLTGFDTLALIAAGSGSSSVTVAIDGGHGEWFIGGDGSAARSLTPERAAVEVLSNDVAGLRSEVLVADRGWGRAIAADADVRHALAMPPTAFVTPARPIYGRQPDAKVAGAA